MTSREVSVDFIFLFDQNILSMRLQWYRAAVTEQQQPFFQSVWSLGESDSTAVKLKQDRFMGAAGTLREQRGCTRPWLYPITTRIMESAVWCVIMWHKNTWRGRDSTQWVVLQRQFVLCCCISPLSFILDSKWLQIGVATILYCFSYLVNSVRLGQFCGLRVFILCHFNLVMWEYLLRYTI